MMKNINRNLLIGIVTLLILTNIAMMLFIWKSLAIRKRSMEEPKNYMRTERFIHGNLNLSPKQLKEFKELSYNHRQKMNEIQLEIRLLNRDFHEAIILGNNKVETKISLQLDSLSREVKKETVAHIRALANVCSSKQKKKLLQELNKLPDRRGNRGDRRKGLRPGSP